MKQHNLDGSPIHVTEHVGEYRKAITQLVNNTDVVLEVGCAEGCTTAIIAQHAKQAFGIDRSQSQIAKAVSRHQQIPNLSFRQIDAWDLNAVLHWSQECGTQFSVIFVDVSGSRPVGHVDQILTKYEILFQPRLFVVKNYQLKRLINRCRPYPPLQEQQQVQQQEQQQEPPQQQQQQEDVATDDTGHLPAQNHDHQHQQQQQQEKQQEEQQKQQLQQQQQQQQEKQQQRNELGIAHR